MFAHCVLRLTFVGEGDGGGVGTGVGLFVGLLVGWGVGAFEGRGVGGCIKVGGEESERAIE